MNNASLIALAWIAFALHPAVALMVQRRFTDVPLIPLLNLAVALCVLAYWARKWYSYLFKGIIWYASDQWIPLDAVGVCVLAWLTFSGRYRGAVPHGVVFVVDALVLLAAALFFTFFRMDRLI